MLAVSWETFFIYSLVWQGFWCEFSALLARCLVPNALLQHFYVGLFCCIQHVLGAAFFAYTAGC